MEAASRVTVSTVPRGRNPWGTTRLIRLFSGVLRWFGTRTGFCVSLALAVVAMQQAFYYFEMFFLLKSVPSHDLFQGAGFFATSMHSVRLSGDIVWWNPLRNAGYAQYFQSFLSPLAPTSGHIVFIVWQQAIRVLAAFGVALPEYYQYLVVTYLVLPFLTYLSFAAFLSVLFSSRATIALVSLVYGFSGIALWNMGWFYMQESFTMYFLLAGALGFVRHPGARTLFWAVAALLVQVSSINYWTVYNSWFISLLLGAYAVTHRSQVRLATSWLVGRARDRRLESAAIAVGITVVCGLWFAIILDAKATGLAYDRYTLDGAAYSMQEALARIHTMRSYTLELFTPILEESTPADNTLHRARYLGAELIPLLILVPLYRWRRRDRFLAVCAVGILVICLGAPIALLAWKFTPGMDRIGHALYFYTHHWQVIVTLMAGSAFDRLLLIRNAPLRRHFDRALAAVIGVAALTLLWTNLATVTSESVFRQTVFVLVTASLLKQCVHVDSSFTRRSLSVAILVLLLADLSQYFYKVSRADHEYSLERWHWKESLDASTRTALKKPWSGPDFTKGYEAGIAANMPISCDVWPENFYLVSSAHQKLVGTELSVLERPSPLGFFDHAVVLRTDEARQKLKDNGGAFQGTLVLHQEPSRNWPPSKPGSGEEATSPFGFEWKKWTYNSHEFTVNAPRDGWLYISQIHDRDWTVMVDGKPETPLRANVVGMAVPVTRGRHEIFTDYRPLARKLYGPACVGLEGALVACAILGSRARHRRTRGSR